MQYHVRPGFGIVLLADSIILATSLVIGIRALPTRWLFGSSILCRLLLRVSLVKPTSVA
jgi:hypothetical protein